MTTNNDKKSMDLKIFAENLHRTRLKAGLTQSDLARKVWGVQTDSRGYTVARNRDLISSYERGRSAPSRDNLVRLAEALGTTPEALAPGFGVPAVERQTPAIAMTMVEGKPDQVILTINKVTSLATASRVIALLAETPDG